MAAHIAFTTCPLCEASCGLRVETDAARRHVLAIGPDPDDVLSRGHMCTKARALADLHDDPDRLRQPMRRTPAGDFEPIGWPEALALAVERLHAVRAAHGRDALGIYLGNPTVHNHETLLAVAALVAALRTRNRYSASSSDQVPQMFAALQMFGHQLMIPVPDLDRSDLVVLIGANPAASNGSLMTAPGIVRRLRDLQRRGGRVVVLDPRATETAALADEHHFIRPGTDALALLAILHVLFAEGLVEPGHLRPWLAGLDDLARVIEPWTPERVAPATGLAPDALRLLARTIAGARRACVYGRVGVCTQRFGGLAAWLVQLVNIVTGNLDRAGGMMFTRPAFDGVALASLLRQQGSWATWRTRGARLPEFGGEQPVSAMADEIVTAGRGQMRALITLAGNPVLSTPNGARLERALGSLDFMVSLDLYLNETSRHADLVLPPVSPLERPAFHMALAMFSVRHTAKYQPAVLTPPDDARHDWQVLFALARGLLAREGLGGRLAAGALGVLEAAGGPRLIADLGIRFGPYGSLGRRGEPHAGPLARGLTLAELEREPHGIDLGALRPVLPGRLATPEGRIRLAPSALVGDLARLERALRRGELGERGDGRLLLIGRRHLRSNNSWMHNTERLAARPRDCTLLMHPDDAATRGLSAGERVEVRSRTGRIETTVELSERVMAGVVSLPHGHGHDRRGARLRVAAREPGVSINDLTDERHVDELTGNAGFSGVPVEVIAAAAASSDAQAPLPTPAATPG